MNVADPEAALRALREAAEAWGGSRPAFLHLAVPPGQRAAVLRRLEARPEFRVVDVRPSPELAAELGELNRARDVLPPEPPALLFVTASGEEARWLRRHALDLATAFDLRVELRPRAPGGWAEQRARLAEAMRARHGALDLTGLLPGATEVVRLSLDEGFMPSAATFQPAEPGPGGEARPLLLLAPPGKGKTTALRARAARQADPEGRLVLFAPLAGWAVASRDRLRPLLDHLERVAAAALGEPDARVPLGEHLDETALLLDGLDEVPDREPRRRLLREARALARRGARVLVSGRDHVVTDLPAGDLEGWRTARLGDPEPADIRRFVTAVFRGRRGEEAEARARALLDRLAAEPDLGAFARTPLLLAFLVVLADSGRALPDQRVLLYHELVEMLIGTWRRIRSAAGAPRPLSRAEVLRVVAPLGWWIVLRGGGAVSEAELLAELARLERRREPDPELARRAARERLAQLEDDTALVRTDGGWRFTHPTLAEFLAARAALQDPACLDALCRDPFWPGWSQVLPFALALATDVHVRDEVSARLVEALLRRSRKRGRYDARFPTTLARALRETRALPATAERRLAGRALEITYARRLGPRASLDAQRAALAIAELRRPGVRLALRDWFCPPRRAILWTHLVRGAGSPPVTVPWLFQPTSRLPEALAAQGLDARPLLDAWLAHEEPRVRLLGWISILRARGRLRGASLGELEAALAPLDPGAAGIVAMRPALRRAPPPSPSVRGRVLADLPPPLQSAGSSRSS